MAGDRFFNAELKLRIVSAIVLGVIVLTITWLGSQTFQLLWAVTALLIFHEFTRIVVSQISFAIRLVGALMLLIVLAAWFSGDHHTAYLISAVSVSTLATWEAFTRRPIWTASAFLYSVLPFFALSELRGAETSGLYAIIILFACVWGADIFAYIFGRLIGGPKLAPKISPKKTWAGFAGSLIGAILLCYLVTIFIEKEASVTFWLLILCIAVASQIGDLVISVLKRKFGVKDTGKIIPGHGGVLDRIDGLIPASIILWGLLKYYSAKTDTYEEIGSALFLL